MIINVLQGRRVKKIYYYPHFTEMKILYRSEGTYCSVKSNYLPRLVDRKSGI